MKLCPKCQKQFSDDANFCPVDAARLVPYTGGDAGGDSLTTRFTLGARIGGNRTGAVHRATDKTTGKDVAVKLVAPAVVALPGVAQRLERELKQLERVQSAGVAHVIASGKRGEEWWIATELVDGAQTLAQAIAARGPIPADRAAELVELIGEALIEAAQVGVVHRDLAPKNVLFSGQDVKLVNFSLPVPGDVPGVADFVAPEQGEGKPVDQRSNLYSLGAIYYFVLTGQVVVPDLKKQTPGGTIPPPSKILPSSVTAGSPIEGAILRALDRNPTRRFLTVRQFVDEVRRVGHAEVIELTQTLPMGRSGKPRAELVHTLMGFQGNGMAPLTPAPSAPTAPGGVVGVQPPVVAASAPQPAPKAAIGAQTMLGVPSGAGAPAPAPAVAPAPAAAPAAPAPAESTPAAPAVAAAPSSSAAPTVVLGPPVVAPPVVAPPVVAPPVVARPATQPPVVAAPQVAPPQVAAQPAGRRKPADEGGGGGKGKFRETMWFKKGELDAAAAQSAADERAKTGKDVATDKADLLPIDDRYSDDGSITRSDKEKYSLRTGATQMMPAMRDAGPEHAGAKVSEDALIDEMKGGRGKILAIVGVGVVLLVVLIVLLAS